MKTVVLQQVASSNGELPMKHARAAVFEQLRGMTLSASALGTRLRIDTPTGSVDFVVRDVVDGEVQVARPDNISFIRPRDDRASHSGPLDDMDLAAIRERMGAYASRVQLFRPASSESLRANERLSWLEGTPSNAVVEACVASLRGSAWLLAWSEEHYGRALDALPLLQDSVPLHVLAGDPGTGKSVTLRNMAGAVAMRLDRTTVSIHLNERLRGSGIQGRAGTEVVTVFEGIRDIAEQSSVPIIVSLDEAEAVAGHRVTADVGSGEKENTAILDGMVKGLDALGSSIGHVVAVFATNLLGRLDPAIVRRAQVYQFERPDEGSLRRILQRAFSDVFAEAELDLLLQLTRRSDLSLTGADVLSQIVQPAVRAAAADARPLELEDVATFAEKAVAARPVA